VEEVTTAMVISNDSNRIRDNRNIGIEKKGEIEVEVAHGAKAGIVKMQRNSSQ
jgi:hypothetical protein